MQNRSGVIAKLCPCSPGGAVHRIVVKDEETIILVAEVRGLEVEVHVLERGKVGGQWMRKAESSFACVCA